MNKETSPVKMEPQTDLEQAKNPKPTTKNEESINVICNRESRLRYVLMIIATVFCVAVITLSFYLANKFK